MSHTPPRLLAGVIVLIWGGLTGNGTWGLVAAILLEAKAWTGLRWDFGRGSYIRAWQFSILVGALLAILAWVNGTPAGKLHTLFVWAPLVLLPMELAQRYGRAQAIPLNTFSFFARKKMDRDIAQGRPTSPRMLNTGYPYIAVVILATAMASRHGLHHYAGLSVATAACLYFYVRKSGFRPLAWSAALLLTLSVGFAGQWGMFKLYQYVTGARSGGSGGHRTYTNEARTSIGQLGKLKQSPRIFWRMAVREGNVPPLLRTAAYNRYSLARWTHEFIPPPGSDPLFEDDFTEDTRLQTFQERDTRTFGEDTALDLSELGDLSITGEVDSSIKNNPIPMPGNTLAYGDLGGEPSVSRNSLGTVRIGNPENHVISYTVWLGDRPVMEDDPIPEFDLHVPAQEKEAVARVAQQLGLKRQGLGTRAKISILRDFFAREFRYTTHLQTPGLEKGRRQTAVGTFLEVTRSGHCEYFATATALLLREAGVPARYCVGFSVSELDSGRDEWVLRGHHAHAWCRVWVESKNQAGETVGEWEDADLTPPDWIGLDAPGKPDWQRRLTDWWQRVREDFLIWRTREANKTKVAVTVGIISSLLLLWIGWRLWLSRQRGTAGKQQRYRRPKDTPLTALHKLEPLVARRIGHRPAGTPLCRWMLQLTGTHPWLEDRLVRVTELHSRLRFDPAGTPPETADELARLASALRRDLRRKTP